MTQSNPEASSPDFCDVQHRVTQLNEEFEKTRAEFVVARCLLEQFPDQLAVVSSFGADSAVVLHMISSIDPDTPVLFLDTGMHFPETLNYRRTLADQLGLRDVRLNAPNRYALAELDPVGTLHKTNPDGCCGIRKKNVLKKALSPFRAWVSGRKRFQTENRASMRLFEYDQDMRIKINPLYDWSEGDIEHYFDRHRLPRHPLWKHGYKSIGCAPCTRPVARGEDGRAGRWSSCGKTECGIHL